MKKTIFSGILFLCFLFAGNNFQASAQSQLTQGEIINVSITQNLSSGNMPSTINAIVDYDVKDPSTGKVLIARGTPVIINATYEKRKGLGRPGMITLNAVSTKAVDGQLIHLKGNQLTVTGDKRRGLALGLGIGLPIGTIVCFPWGFACLAIKGKNAEIPAGTSIDNVMVQGNYTIQ